MGRSAGPCPCEQHSASAEGDPDQTDRAVSQHPVERGSPVQPPRQEPLHLDGHQGKPITISAGDGSTVREAIECSGLLPQFPEIDLSTQAVGIFGRIVKLDTRVNDGDRVEIYRPITADPETVERRDID
jgi:putative ubiquitin-RnfH superfamily antitoxin RatB of RatAB toxin-antitoxin module